MVYGKIIVVEDDPDLLESVLEYLHIKQFNAVGAANALEFYKKLSSETFDLAIVDLGLPDGDGFELVEHLRRHIGLGIIILTAQGGTAQKIRGYHCGADYYFVKPVEMAELVAAIRNLLSRLATRVESAVLLEESWCLHCQDWTLVGPQKQQIDVTGKELTFLQELVAVNGETVTRTHLLQQLSYPLEGPYGGRALDTLVARLRKKIKSATGFMPIKTVHALGYRFSSHCRYD
ncbi:response regulator transcription factor [uncultured Desulfuromonas sp.]|uniref:response regulator transcription factor n=1 Tax=uncultured Desulfuromonas sp. TaxID=181013 RepID=UPI002AAADC97|nr:response regulator transcription factor [uncultured Desulfuromonas sp.]